MSNFDSAPAGSYEPAAIYYGDSDCLEYVRADTFCLYERVDEFLTLIKDESGENLVGFKLKGFRNRFKKLQSALDLSEGQFLCLITAIEGIYTEIGAQMFNDKTRAEAYRAAYQLAANDNVKLDRSELRAAA